MMRRASAGVAWLMFMTVLAACNLLTQDAPGIGETSITGAPVVRIVSPLPNATYLEGVSVNIQAAVSNAGTDIDRIEIVVDNQIVASLPQPNAAGAANFSIAHTWEAEGTGAHTIGVTAFRADGSSSAPAAVSVNVVSAASQPERTQEAASQPEATQETSSQTTNTGSQQQAIVTNQPTNPPAPTNAPQPEATVTSNRPIVTFNQGANLRRGPSTKFNPPIGSYNTGQTADIVARTPAGDWFKIRGANGEGWVFGQLVTASGDLSQVQVDAGPPVPTDTPAIPTATPVPPTPVTTANLVAGNHRFDPGTPRCKQTFNIYIDVANLGQQVTAATGSILVEDFSVRDGALTQRTFGAIPIIQPGQTVNIGPIPITIDTYVDEDHRMVITLNNNGAIPETTSSDNRREITYRLTGPC